MAGGSLLHVGCGGEPLPDWLQAYEETRLDVDAASAPDIVANMSDLGDIGTYDRVYCSHALEHLSWQDAEKTLMEFKRVLNPGGCALVIVPDLTDIRPTKEVIYESLAGPITGLDMFYGKQDLVAERPYMAHRIGFVQATLQTLMDGIGFSKFAVTRLSGFNLLALGVK